MNEKIAFMPLNKRKFLSVISLKRLLSLLCLPVLFLAIIGLSSCKKQTDYFSYVSECRSDIFTCEGDGFSLKMYAVSREQPYLSDGVKRECTQKAEAFLTTDRTQETFSIGFIVGEKEYGGEMSFDNARTEYYFSCTVDISSLRSIPVKICYGGTVYETNAINVRTETAFSPEKILQTVLQSEHTLIENMTDRNGFCGEFYIRLIYEDGLYYYVGIIGTDQKTHALLLNAETGKILARREC